tara:strand:- start:388 stop:618 length:231 start_codon:yes stop_codon:yes gene_type:complete
MSKENKYCKALQEQLSRITDTNNYLIFENTNLFIKNQQLQKEKQNLEKELALIKKPTVSKNVFTHEPIDDIIASIF